jgi:hypothetical protein
MEGGKIMDKKKWTFMVYMAGDNNLSDAGDTDLREMRKVGSTPDVNVVAQFDNEGDRGTNRYLIKRDGLNEEIESMGMDACLMSNLEVAYQARPYVKYIVASEESEPNEGWPYAAVLEKLVNAPMLAPADLASHIVAAYVKSYVDMKYEGPVTQSTFDLSKISMVTEPLDKLANALIAHMPKAEKEIWGAQRKSARFWHNTLWDIAHFCEELEKQTANKAVRDAAKNVRTALQSGPKQFVLAESHRGASVARCAGATIYLLPALMDVSPYYGELKYAKEHRWPALLKAYHAVV